MLLQDSSSSEDSTNKAIPEAMDSIYQYSDGYLRYFIINMRRDFSRGHNAANVLLKNKLFDKNLVVLITMYAESNQLKQGLKTLGNEYLDKQMQVIGAAFKAI